MKKKSAKKKAKKSTKKAAKKAPQGKSVREAPCLPRREQAAG
jgi:hypothetical protein